MRNHQTPKGKRAAQHRRQSEDPDRLADGRFKTGNQVGTATKTNHLLHGKAGADRLERDVALHGSRSRALDRLVNGPQPWAEMIRQWREQTVQAYGGWDAMTPVTHEILSMATVMKVIVDSIGDYAAKTNPINKRSRKLFPVIESLDRLMVSQANRLEKFATMMRQAQRNQEPSLDDLLNEAE